MQIKEAVLLTTLVLATYLVASIDGRSIRAAKDTQKSIKEKEREKLKNPVTYFEKFGYVNPKLEKNGKYNDLVMKRAIKLLVVFKWDGLACRKTRFNHTVGSILSSASPKSGQYNHCSYLYIIVSTKSFHTRNRKIRHGNITKNGKIKMWHKGVEDCGVKRYSVHSVKWSSNNLTWKLENYTPDLTVQSQKEAIAAALKKWSDASNLNILEDNTSPDIKVSFQTGDHSDGDPFDGKGFILAHASLPEDGEVHFDDDEVFTRSLTEELSLDYIAIHEFGHSLGVLHSENADAVMYPWYNTQRALQLELHQDDIDGIRYLYGPKLD